MDLSKILIVDDNQDLSHALKLRLQANNYEALLAKDGASALALALAEKPLAVLLDLRLTNEDGCEVMEELHRRPELSYLPVIIVSADCSLSTQNEVLDAGAHSFLEKPVNHRLLLHILHDIQVRSQPQDRLTGRVGAKTLQD